LLRQKQQGSEKGRLKKWAEEITRRSFRAKRQGKKTLQKKSKMQERRQEKKGGDNMDATY